MVESCLRVKIDFIRIVLCVFLVCENGTEGILPEASQEGLLHPFKSYADVILFHYNVPPQVSRATWEFAAFMDHPSCAVREVHIYIQHGSYPVMEVGNASFPDTVYTGRTHLHHIVSKSAYQPHDATVFPINSPLPGNWFVAAFLSPWDKQVTQEGLGVQCHYSLGSIALWSQVMNIATLRPGASHSIFRTTETYSYYKLYIPAGTWSFDLRISNCSVLTANRSVAMCIQNLDMRARALPIFNPNNTNIVLEGGEFTFTEMQPFTESYYYLLVASEASISFSIELVTKECGTHIVGDGVPLRVEEALETAAESRVRHSNQSVRSDWANIMLPSSQKYHIKHQTSNKKKDDVCLPCIQMARITHAQNFADTFFLQGREFYTTWMPVSEYMPTMIQFEIMPFLDIGGTLSISIRMDDVSIFFHRNSGQTMHVTACIRKGRAPQYKDGVILCSSELQLVIASDKDENLGAVKLIPYPEPDIWFISFKIHCTLDGSTMPCLLHDMLVLLDIHTQPCLFSGKSCGEHGTCQEIHKGLHFFTSCNCQAGYRGWGCNDGSEAKANSTMLWTTFLLTGSNLFFLPVVFLSIRRGLLTQALVYASTMIFSMLYHACDQEVYSYCITKYEVLQFGDFFSSILSLWVTLVALSGLPAHLLSALHMLGVLIIAVGVQYNRTGLLVFIVPFALGVFVPLCTWLIRSWHKRACVPLRCWSLALLLPGIALAATGVILFAFIETEHNYQYVHSAWHVVMALSLIFLLPQPVPGHNKDSSLACSDSAEMFGINDYDTGNPVFVVTSDMDSLIPGQVNAPHTEQQGTN